MLFAEHIYTPPRPSCNGSILLLIAARCIVAIVADDRIVYLADTVTL